MKKYLFIFITVTITQFLFSSSEAYEVPEKVIKKQLAIEKIETHKRVEIEALEKTKMQQEAKRQREIQLRNEAMENRDNLIEIERQRDKSKYTDLYSSFIDQFSILKNDKRPFEGDLSRGSGDRCLDIYINGAESLSADQGEDLTLTVNFCDALSSPSVTVAVNDSLPLKS